MTDADKLRTFITQLSPVAESYGKKSVISNINTQIADLEKSTSVLFCGEFKRGKSSLINAIIGETLCPTDVGIATSVVSIIRYGAKKKAYRYYGNLLENADALKKKEIGWQDVEKYAMGGVLDIDNTILIELFYPAPFLKDGITIIDTPGVGGLDPRHAILTYMALPKADVIVFVTDAGEPMTEAELKFYQDKIVPCGKQNMVLINKSDCLTEDVLKTHIDSTKLALAKAGAPEVLPVSAAHWIHYNVLEDDDLLASSNKDSVLASISVLVEKYRKRKLMDLRDMLMAEVADISRAVDAEIEQLGADSKTYQDAMESLKLQLEELKNFINDIRNPQSAINLRINSIFEDARNEVSNTISHEGVILTSTDFDDLLNSENGLANDGKWFVSQINDKLQKLSFRVDAEIEEAFEKISDEIECEISDTLTSRSCLVSGDLKECSIINSQLAFSIAGKFMTGSLIGGGALIVTELLVPGIGIVAGLATAAALIWKQVTKETQQQKRASIRQQVLPKVNLAITDLRNQANMRFSKFHQNLLLALQTLASEAGEKIRAIQGSMQENYGNEQECKNRIAALQQRDKFLQTLIAQLNLLYSTPFAHAE